MSVPDDSEMTIAPVAHQSFDELMMSDKTDVLWSFDSEDLTDKASLLGVPMVITQIAYRYSELPDPANSKLIISGDYVSVTARLGNLDWFTKAIEAGRIPNVSDLSGLPKGLEPEALVVFNDGSTGIRRQLTGLLHHAGIINVGGDFTKDKNGIFDRKFFEWTYCDPTQTSPSSDDAMQVPTIVRGKSSKPLVIYALKGLRASEYAYGSQMATTYYLG